MTRSCEFCETPYEPAPGGVPGRSRFCSRVCQVLAYRDVARKRGRPWRARARAEGRRV